MGLVITDKARRNMGAPLITSANHILRSPASHKLTTLRKFGVKMSAGQDKIAIDDVYIVKGLHKEPPGPTSN